MYFTNGSSRAFEMLMRGKPGFDRYENGGCADCEDCNTCHFYRPHWKYQFSTPVSNPQPGDLVFFVGTYDTPGVSHVGIYVGNSMMIHCGDPISYSNLNSSYWQAHFYAYARPPYN